VEGTGRAAVAEFVGTFVIVFVAAGTIVATQGADLVAVAIGYGLAVAAMVSISARVSGGVFNPAVQLALWFTGTVGAFRCAVLVVAQIVAAVAAAFAVKSVSPTAAFDAVHGGAPAVAAGFAVGRGVLVEALATFFLVWVFFAVLVDERGPGSGIGGLLVGAIVTVDVLATWPLTGTAINPARWLGPAMAAGMWTNWWVWVVGPVSGAVIGAVAYWWIFLKSAEPATT
jgi:MIP family channel proteins